MVLLSTCGRGGRERRDALGDVAVDEDVALDRGCDHGLGNARVGAAEPEDLAHGLWVSHVTLLVLYAYLGLLPFCDVVEGVGIEPAKASRPLLIPREDAIDDRVGRGMGVGVVHNVDEQLLAHLPPTQPLIRRHRTASGA